MAYNPNSAKLINIPLNGITDNSNRIMVWDVDNSVIQIINTLDNTVYAELSGGGTPTLAEVLAEGNSTNGLSINNDVDNTSVLNILDSGISLLSSSAEVHITGPGILLYNEEYIKLEAISVTKNGVEIATIQYKVYTALLTQSGVTAPVATVLENTIGAITLTYSAPGEYYITSSSLFTTGKVYAVITNNWDAFDTGSIMTMTLTPQSASSIYIRTGNVDSHYDDILNNTPFEIRVYN